MKRSKTKSDCLRGLVPDHIRIMWLDEEFDLARVRTGKPIILKWPESQRMEEFHQVNYAAQQYDIPASYVEKAIKFGLHITAIPGSPKAFFATDPRVSEMVYPPEVKKIGAFGRKAVKVIFPDGNEKIYLCADDAGNELNIHPQTISLCIREKRPNKNGLNFRYLEDKID